MTRPALIGPLLCLALAGCASSGSSPSSGTSDPAPQMAAGAVSTATATASTLRAPPRRPRPARHAPSGAGLAYSTAAADQVQAQPSPGSCTATGSGLYSQPDPRCTPGALNSAVTQATIDQTICVAGYTKTIRPPESITEREKQGSMAAYGDGGSMSGYEYDHLISLELGGAANDPRNLWPEPGRSPNPKDSVEDELHRRVCAGELSLAAAQHIIATGWVSYAHGHSAPSSPPPSVGSAVRSGPPPAPSGSSGPDKPISEVNCSDFPTHAAAQQWFVAHGGSAGHNVAGLDGNHNGIACEDLP